MLTSICPLGERARRQPYLVTVVSYVSASVIAAAAFGAALGGLGALASDVVPAVDGVLALGAVALVATAGLVADLATGDRPLPGPARQVDEDWLVQFRGWVYGAGFGVQLGLGITTFVVASATYVTWVAAALSASAAIGALIGATYGLARSLPVLVTADVHDGTALRNRVRRLHRWRPIVHRVLLTTQAATVVVIFAVLVERGLG